jgi:hypothetical protein
MIKTWVRTTPTRAGDVAKIMVNPEVKVRFIDRKIAEGPMPDKDWLLWRRDVPSLTDEQWYASPGPEWEEG